MRYFKWLILFASGAVVGWAVTLYWLHPPISSGDSASWVQAVGTIAAVLAAFVIGNQQTRDAIRRESAANFEAMEASLSIFDGVNDPLQEFRTHCNARVDEQKPDGMDSAYSRFHNANFTFSRLQLHETKSVVFVRSFAKVMGLFDRNGPSINNTWMSVVNREALEKVSEMCDRLNEIRRDLLADVERLKRN